MNQGRLSDFIINKKMRLRDIVPVTGAHDSSQLFYLSKYFNPYEILRWHLDFENRRNFSIAFTLAEYMSKSKTDEIDRFEKLASYLRDEEWDFAIKFCFYHKVQAALDNLNLIYYAMIESSSSLSSCLAKIDSTREIGEINSFAHDSEKSRATSHVLTFSSLYTLFVDISKKYLNIAA